MPHDNEEHHHRKLVSFNNVSLSRGQQTLVENINFSIYENEVTTLLGPNGAGKTSLTRLLVGLDAPTSGRLDFHQNVTIGYVPQYMNLKKSLPLTGYRFLKSGRQTSKKAFDQAVELAQAHSIMTKDIAVLSGGEKQRLLLARALLGSPSLLVLDEPMQGIDLQGQEELYGLLNQIQTHFNTSIFLVSHDLHIVMSGSDHILCLNKHICCSGSSSEVQHNPIFLKMFGLESAAHLAIYQHHHDHHHGFSQPKEPT